VFCTDEDVLISIHLRGTLDIIKSLEIKRPIRIKRMLVFI